MGVKYARDFKDIINDLSIAIADLQGFYQFFGMEDNEWNELDKEEQDACVRTLCDDIFYVLGENSEINVGNGTVKYDEKHHNIAIFNGKQMIQLISLI